MAAFAQLFGDTLQGKSGLVATTEALADKKGVLVYFSAHWCPPCRGFTPKLAEFHRKHAVANGFETIFVSSDQDQEAFDSYFDEMPWLALPFADRDRKASLNKLFKVGGIPTLVVLGPDGKVFTTNGREKVMENFDTCADFPWKPPSFSEALGEAFVRKDGSSAGMEALRGKTLGLYFSAHWCPPCRNFTPKLKEFYEEYKASNQEFEIVFVSSDQDEDAMQSYFKDDHGDYLALPYSKRKEKAMLSDLFDVQGIPAFVVVGADGTVINASARAKIMQGAKAILESGWAPPVVGDLSEGPEVGGTDIDACSAVIVLCDGCDVTTQASIQQALAPLAQKYIDEAKATDGDPKYIFFVAKDQGSADPVKAMTQKQAGKTIAKAGKSPVVLLLDIPDNGGFYLSDVTEVTTAGVERFLKSREDGKETRLQLGGGGAARPGLLKRLFCCYLRT